MVSSSRRTVLTGMGVVSPLGRDTASYWDGLRQGRSGIGPLSLFDAAGLPVRFAGVVPEFDIKKFVDKKDRKNIKLMARSIELAVAASQLAVEDARLDKNKIDPTRFGVDFGAGLIATDVNELAPAAEQSSDGASGSVDLEKWGAQGLGLMTPLWMLKYLPNMLACHVSIVHNAQGPNNTIIESEVGSLLALGEAARIIARNQADLFLTGGGDSRLNPLSMVRQCLFQPLSQRNEAPEKASRPFDRQRDGMVLGEGAGVFVLEEREHALRRGARIYAELVGFGAAFDRERTGAGLARAIRAALAEAGIGPEAIDHVNAQGFSTVEEDIREARGLQEVFGHCTPPVPVFAAKSYLGNVGAGSGAVELAASLLALQHGVLPPTLNYEEADPNCPIHVLAGAARPVQKEHILKVSFTDMGQCAAIVCRQA